MEEKQININGINTNYKVAGNGPIILILHGWGGSSNSWVNVQSALAAGGYKVVIPDLPGFGKSQPPPVPWGIQEYSDFSIEFSNKAGLGDFFLIGHSFGGRLIIRLADSHKERIKGLVLCDAAGIKPAKGAKTMLVFLMARIGNSLFTPRRLQRFKASAREIFYKFSRTRDYSKAKGVMRGTMRKVLEEDLASELESVKIKTLLVWGEVDKLVPLKYGRIFKERIAGSELIIIPKVGHSPQIEVPEKLAEIIMNFFSKISK